MRWPPPLSRAHPPGVVALHTLAAPLTKPSNRSATTGGFRMFGVHACELPQPPACCPTRKRPSPCQTSTEFLYPSPICDFKSVAEIGLCPRFLDVAVRVLRLPAPSV